MSTPRQRKLAQVVKQLCLIPGFFPKTVVAVILIWVSIGEPALLSETSSLVSRLLGGGP